MTTYIKRHTLQTRLTHGIAASCFILLSISGLFVFVPALNNLLPSEVTFAMRMAHRVIGVILILAVLISAVTAPKGVKHLAKNYFAKWDKDDKTFMKLFVPYMLSPKKVHMPDQHEVKSGQRVADGVLFLIGFLICGSGVVLMLGTAPFSLAIDGGVMMVMRLLHDIAFLMFAVFGIAHIFLGAGMFQPYRRMRKVMFGNGLINESDALYHWGHWAREELESREKVVEINDEKK
ncbi:MAG TPA: formate dehydrogenase [Coriobacteriia bacterium]|nr:formate dehydrogenase [Coriobacteriia bacterium]